MGPRSWAAPTVPWWKAALWAGGPAAAGWPASCAGGRARATHGGGCARPPPTRPCPPGRGLGGTPADTGGTAGDAVAGPLAALQPVRLRPVEARAQRRMVWRELLNDRFLVLPRMHAEHLANHVLAAAAGDLPGPCCIAPHGGAGRRILRCSSGINLPFHERHLGRGDNTPVQCAVVTGPAPGPRLEMLRFARATFLDSRSLHAPYALRRRCRSSSRAFVGPRAICNARH